MFVFKLFFSFLLTINFISSLIAGEAVVSEASIYANQFRNVQIEISVCEDLAFNSSEKGEEQWATHYQKEADRCRRTGERIKERLNEFGNFNYDDYNDPTLAELRKCVRHIPKQPKKTVEETHSFNIFDCDDYEDPELAKLNLGIRYTPDGIGYDRNGRPINITKEAKGKEREDEWLQRKKLNQKTSITYKCLSVAATFIGTIFVTDKLFKSYFEEEKKKFNLLSPEEKTRLTKLNQTPEKRRWMFNIYMGVMSSIIVGFFALLL